MDPDTPPPIEPENHDAPAPDATPEPEPESAPAPEPQPEPEPARCEPLPDPDRDAIEARKAEWRPGYVVETPEQEWLFEQLIVAAIGLDCCRAQGDAIRRDEMARARLAWDDDRRIEAADLGATLARRPERVVLRLRRTTQGADWLIGRWALLGRIFEREGKWDEAEMAMALDLLGTPVALRKGAGPIDDPAALVAREVAALERLKARSLDPLDAQERQKAESGSPRTTSKELSALRRHEDAVRRHYHWALSQLAKRDPQPEPAPLPEPEPTPAPTPAPPPPPPPERPRCEPGTAAPVVAPSPAPVLPVAKAPQGMSSMEWSFFQQRRLIAEMERQARGG